MALLSGTLLQQYFLPAGCRSCCPNISVKTLKANNRHRGKVFKGVWTTCSGL